MEEIARRRLPMPTWIRKNGLLLAAVLLMVALPFIVALLDGQSIPGMMANEPGNSKFVQGLMIEIFILAVFAISYDLTLGITGLLSLGHAFFFALNAYLTGIMFKTFGWSLLPTLGLVVVAGILQALLFAVVLPRVGGGLTFALVTFGMASVFDIVIRTRELADYTGAEVGLQGVPVPEFLNPADRRLTFYFVALIFTVVIYLLYRRFVDSPTGRVCIAIRDNEDRARMLGYNVFYFQLAALIVSAVTAGLAGAMHTLYKPLVSPAIAGLHYTVDAFLILLIGGMGTLSGALVGAAAYRLSDFYLHRWFEESSEFILGAVYVALVLFVPYGIVGTWKQRSFRIKEGWQRLIELFTGRSGGTPKARQPAEE